MGGGLGEGEGGIPVPKKKEKRKLLGRWCFGLTELQLSDRPAGWLSSVLPTSSTQGPVPSSLEPQKKILPYTAVMLCDWVGQKWQDSPCSLSNGNKDQLEVHLAIGVRFHTILAPLWPYSAISQDPLTCLDVTFVCDEEHRILASLLHALSVATVAYFNSVTDCHIFWFF